MGLAASPRSGSLMRPLQIRSKMLVGLVATGAVACGWLVALHRWRSSRPRPAERIVAAVLDVRATRPAGSRTSGNDLAPAMIAVLAALAASRRRQGVVSNIRDAANRPAAGR